MLVGEGGMVVSVGVFVMVEVEDGVKVGVKVGVAVGVNVDVKVRVWVGVCVYVGVYVDGRKGVFVTVGVNVSVGVREAVLVRIMGVILPEGVKMLKVPVAVMGVSVGVRRRALGSGASCTAIQPRQ